MDFPFFILYSYKDKNRMMNGGVGTRLIEQFLPIFHSGSDNSLL